MVEFASIISIIPDIINDATALEQPRSGDRGSHRTVHSVCKCTGFWGALRPAPAFQGNNDAYCSEYAQISEMREILLLLSHRAHAPAFYCSKKTNCNKTRLPVAIYLVYYCCRLQHLRGAPGVCGRLCSFRPVFRPLTDSFSEVTHDTHMYIPNRDRGSTTRARETFN